MPGHRQDAILHPGRVSPTKPTCRNMPAPFALPAWLDVSCECLRFLYGYVRIRDESDQIVRRVSPNKAFAGPVIRQPNLMNHSTLDLQWPHAPRDKYSRLNLPSRS